MPEESPWNVVLRAAAYAGQVPRPPRLQVPGGVYHVGTRGVRREEIYRSTGDYELFKNIVGHVVERFEWRCHTYCLMPNHYHLLIETPASNLSAGMQRLNGTYAQWFNHLHGFTGHVFERRFFSRLVESSYDLLELARYIALNPVRAGLCEDVAGWSWGSYRALVGEAPRATFLTTEWLLSQFGREVRHAHEAFRTFVREAPPRIRGT
jgi:REP-associated tyrosine transposase